MKGKLRLFSKLLSKNQLEGLDATHEKTLGVVASRLWIIASKQTVEKRVSSSVSAYR
jgi:hypothetical protein